MNHTRMTTFVLALVALLGAMPILGYWLMVGRAPTVTADEAATMLADSHALLVDVRSPEEYATGHIEGAFNWPAAEILNLNAGEPLPVRLRDHTLLLICRNGTRSARAALLLSERLRGQVFNVRGGLAEWTGAAAQCPLAFSRIRLANGESVAPTYRPSSLLEQWAVTLSAFAVKPLYMALSLLLIILLRRARAADLVNLRHAMAAFLAGEAFCALNFLVFGESSYLVEYLHGFGMVLAFGFTTLAFLEAVDARLLAISDPARRCAVLPLCTSCIKNHEEVPCGAQRLFLYLIPMVAAIALMPLTGSLDDVSYNTHILGTAYNHNHPVPFQVFEIRYAPVVAILLFVASFLVLRYRRNDPVPLAKQLFAHGFGFLGFGLFRFFIYGVYRTNLAWYVVWEELSELLFLLLCGVILWLFRKRLFEKG